MRHPRAGLLTGLVLVLGLAGCSGTAPSGHWITYVQDVRAAGLMRTDRAPSDAPFDAEVLEASFEAIAFGFESDPFNTGADVASDSIIRKWQDPMTYAIYAEGEDLATITDVLTPFAETLQRITGHPVRPGSATAPEARETNTLVLYLRDEMFSFFTQYEQLRKAGIVEPSDSLTELLATVNDGLAPWYLSASPCGGQVVVGEGDEYGERGEVLLAIIMIRAELPTPLLQTCVEEELTQTMGLFRDDHSVRPSLFNDDEEFALLTTHDEALLRILYDPRLVPGMPKAKAMPIVRQIIAELPLAL